MLTKFLSANTPGMRLGRTVIQGVLAALSIGLAEYVSTTPMDPILVLVAFPCLMAALSAIMGFLGSEV